MKLFLLAQIFVLLIFLIAFSFLLREHLKYRKIKRLYDKSHRTEYIEKRIRSFYPLVPKPESKQYISKQKSIINAGWGLSVERFYLYKWILFITGLCVLASIQTTNVIHKTNMVISDINYSKSMIDTFTKPTPDNIAREKELFRFIDKKVTGGKELYSKEYASLYVEYIENTLNEAGIKLIDDSKTEAKRLYQKLKVVRASQSNTIPYLLVLFISLGLFNFPDILASIKAKLIEDKKDWEVLNCIFAFSIFGRLPPYSIRDVLESMTVVAEVFKPLVSELLEGIKKGKEEDVFDKVLKKTDSDDLYELFETMRLARDTGLLHAVDDVDEMAADNLKWLEIKGIKRRKAKRLYAMIPVALVFLLGGIYFSYALTIISNPANIM